MKIRSLLITLLAGTLLLSATGCGKKAEAEKAPAKPATDTKQAVEAFGVAKAKEIKNVNLDFTATIDKVNVREGQKVKSSDVLITLDLNEYKAQLKNKETELKALRGEIGILQTSKSGSGPDIAKLQSDLSNAEDLYNKALKELKNKEALFTSGSISQYDLDEFKKSVDAKKKAVDDARFGIGTLRNSKTVEVDQKQTRASQLESEIAVMKDKLSKSYFKDNNIVSDVNNGVVYDIGYKQGDNVTKEKKVLSIMDLDSLIIEADVAEEFIKDVKPGAEVTIIPTADKSKNYKGKVTRISDKAVQKNGETNILVEIVMEDKNDFIMPDFNVDVKIKMENK
ncbi:MAG: HlyD family efflux transporter periplasmic adaptor subunit [Clostridia bacterium]|nr:HlyD family efflux transporter periplasmic adaptor subunit [Clostridia bacterium]